MKLFPHNFKEKLIFGASMALSRWVNGSKNLKEIEVKRILVIKLDEIGDLCYSLHVFDLLKQRYPDPTITLLCKPYCKSMVLAHDSIDTVSTNFSEINHNYDLVVDLRGDWESIWFAALNQPKIRLDRGTVRFANKRRGGHPHEVVTNTQIISPLLKIIPESPMPRLVFTDSNKLKVKKYLLENGLNRFAIFHCSSRKELRRWPADNFAGLAEWVKEKFQLDILFTGDAGDEELVQAIQKTVRTKTFNTCGLFDLSEFAVLVQQAQLYVGNESGPLCIASISGTPSLGLFGPGEPTVFYPYGPKTRYIHCILECNPCDQIHCVHPENTCMQRITLQETQAKIIELLV